MYVCMYESIIRRYIHLSLYPSTTSTSLSISLSLSLTDVAYHRKISKPSSTFARMLSLPPFDDIPPTEPSMADDGIPVFAAPLLLPTPDCCCFLLPNPPRRERTDAAEARLDGARNPPAPPT